MKTYLEKLNAAAKACGMSKTNKVYKTLLTSIDESNVMIIRPVRVSGTCKYKHYDDRRTAFITMLTYMGMTYEIGNDAPKQGKLGWYIKVTL